MTPAQAVEHALAQRVGGGRRLDPALVLGVGLSLGGVAVTQPLALLAGVLMMALVTWRVMGHGLRVAVLIAVAVGGLRATAEVQGHERAWGAARVLVGPDSRCQGEGAIVSSPVARGGEPSFLTDLTLSCDGRAVPGRHRVRLHGGPDDLRRGDRVDVNVQIAPVQILRNLELADPRPGAARREATLSGTVLSLERTASGWGLRHTIDGARAHARRRILATFDPLAAPMARALVLGENDLDPEDDEAFRRSGLAHLLAVSGTHLVFAVVSLVGLMTALLVRVTWLSSRICVARLSAAVGCPLALLYADYAGGSGSAWRAAFMLTAVFAARVVSRRAGPARSLGWSLCAGAAVDPLVAYDISFLLSAAATVGLVCVGSPALAWAERLTLTGKSRVFRYLTASVLATVGSMVPCAPLLALMSPDLTLAGVLANVVAAPLGEIVALPLCLAHAVMTPLPSLELGAARVAGGALLIVRQVAHLSADASALAFAVPPPGALHLVVLGAGGAATLIAAWRGARRRALAFGALSLALLGGAEAWVRWAQTPRGVLRVAQLDVGQGDAALVDLPDGRLMLIDAGGSPMEGAGFDPGARVILPILRERRRAHIDVVVLTHPHPDHYGGITSVLEAVSVGELWVSGSPGGASYRRALAKVPRVRTSAELCDAHLSGADYRLEVIGPCPLAPELGENDNSLVLRFEMNGRALLFTGDAEEAQELALLERGARLDADWLKAGHHGSRTSTSEGFLRAVRPALVGISCGVRNRFGHPHQEVMDRLSQSHISTWRIDDRGSLELTLRGGELHYTGFALRGESRRVPPQARSPALAGAEP
ncbi:MAG: DNA internalization-related competence protein ComEC/Rec2 [Polyangiaceae bacterium]|nr:DNA internalization-related competence protein ComEC/Rec2 [Polyangiaceae bacterium]MCW5790302.1 DNA internalization-related competence protein ComEC/Rec2 [Polyangiaceae bacterium]